MRFLAVIILSLLACQCSGVMKPAQPLGPPQSGKALVTFMYPFEVQGAPGFDVWEDENFLGSLLPGQMLRVYASKGVRHYIGLSDNFGVVKAEIEEGHNYYLLLRPAFGAGKSYVSLEPVKFGDANTEKSVMGWLGKLKAVETDGGAAQNYSKQRQAEVSSIYKKAKRGDITVRTLGPSDFYDAK